MPTGAQPRLLLILTEFPPGFGGMQTHAVHLTRHLAARGYPVEVATYRVTDRLLKQQARNFDASLGVPVHRVLSRLGYWKNVDTLEALSRRLRPDLVYSSTVFYGTLAERTGLPIVCRSVGNDVLRPWQGYPYRALAALVGAKEVQQLIRWWLEHGWYPEWAELLFRKARYQLMQDAARAHRRILANSDFTRSLLEELGVEAARISVVTGGVDAAHFTRPQVKRAGLREQLRLPAEAFVLLTACRFVAKKGIDLLLQSLSQLRRHLPAHLVIVGDGRHRSEYESLASSLGLSSHVTFAGRVEHGDIAPWFWASDVFALASRESVNPFTGTRDVETMGRVLCEANAAGLPVVASKSGGIPSVIADGHNGLLFPENEMQGLVDAVLRVASEPVLANRLADRGLERARETFDWRIILARHEGAFAEALG